MGKRKLITGIVLGALVGGLTALFSKDTRVYTKDKCSSIQDKASHFVNNPSVAIHNTRIAFEEFTKTFVGGAGNTINALNQIEETMDKFLDEKE